MSRALVLGEILRVAADPERHGHKPALIWRNRAFTYQELNAAANRAANALLSLGVQKGDRVAVLGRNCPEYVWLYFALARLGAIMVPVNFWYRSGEIEYTLRQSGASVFVLTARFGAVAAPAIDAYGGIRDTVVWGAPDDAPESAHVLRDAAHLPELMAGASDAAPAIAVSPDDYHIILYTSGTTGFPKGALFTHQAHCLHAIAWSLMTAQVVDDTGLLVYPLFHTGGPDCVLLPHLLVGATVVLLDGADPAEMLDAIARHRATNVFCVPTVWRRLLAHADTLEAAGRRPDVSSVRRCLGSSDTLPAELLEAILRRFDADVYVTYGLTEAGCILTYSKLTRDGRGNLHAVGRPHPLVEVRVVGPDGERVATGEVGEVVARGPTLMAGYWEMPERTAEALAGSWLHSGDLGKLDHEGYLFLSGRAKDVIVTGGEKVYPLEVEKLIKRFPGVADVALIGVPDPEWGESVLACIVRESSAAGAQLNATALQRFVRGRLAGYKCPRYVEFVDALPITSATNKVQKAVLGARFREHYLAMAQERIAGRTGDYTKCKVQSAK
ncbi:MAG: AMP-binding protein [Chloroflexi bacterium]|nr:AMP-binding protein [Chloroflexota bacterium]